MSSYRAEVEYKVRRVVYVEADTKAEAKANAQDTSEWVDALDPQEMLHRMDRVVVRSCKVER